ncbi:subtilase [Annulohypoxylon maeteangense]|uniref:subtilase n=1 Tax=Annulohypoxylon maeteangense TaxID=1927788 RepID=UPI0020086A09|nr:subtilase [Annulohypoxylon maeteangense]KAI0881978.1 subtilase [Annulohypoxylon maeteangense]
MNLLSAFRFQAAPAYDTEDLYDLLVAVLPTFAALADNVLKQLEASNSDLTTQTFHLHFKAKMVNLYAVLFTWDPTEHVQRLSADEDEVRNNLLGVLSELESRFLSWKSNDIGLACKRMGLERKKEDETYLKLRALRRILPEDCNPDEKLVGTLTTIIRIDNKRADKRERLLQTLDRAFGFFFSLQPFGTESDSSCPIRFSDYPWKHLWKLTKTLFNVVEKNWSCQCSISPYHADRKARLNLTHYQRFETAPTPGQVLSNSKALFRVLFPTANSRDTEWQDTEISVKNRDSERAEHIEVENGLCRVIQGVKAGIRPRMVVFSERLWQLNADVEINQLSSPQVRDSEFKSLKDLLQPSRDSRESLLSSIEGKDRLILSFVLATSLVHFIRGPWLQASLNSENICFLVSHSRLLPDITKPYLTTRCSSLSPRKSPRELNQPHRFPDILSLGVILLEIARGSPIEFREPQDHCVVALECMDKWTRICQTGRSRTVPDGLLRAISACIDPKEFRDNGLDKAVVKDFEVRKYIFERILYPLEDALCTAYEIQLNMLHKDIARVKQSRGVGSFDHREENRPEKREAAEEWLEYLEGVHDLFDKCQDQCGNLPRATQKATRVKIALLDTGLQLPGALQENYEEEERINVQQSKTFVPPAKRGAVHDWRIDNDGHGSRVGQIILEFAPGADLHVAKVFQTRDDLADPEIASQVHNRIVEAIEYATTEWKVDMIVMCFGFDEPIRAIRNAIDKAASASKPPLFFAATRNDGAHKRMAWPAKDRSVIGISSTDGYGDISSFNPVENNSDPILYAFGEGVPVRVAALGNADTKYVSGTSYATPVATALAANLLGCVRMMTTSSQENQIIYKNVPEDLQRLDGMLAVLRRHMRKEHNCGTESLLPWDFLNVKLLDKNKILEDVAKILREG